MSEAMHAQINCIVDLSLEERLGQLTPPSSVFQSPYPRQKLAHTRAWNTTIKECNWLQFTGPFSSWKMANARSFSPFCSVCIQVTVLILLMAIYSGAAPSPAAEPGSSPHPSAHRGRTHSPGSAPSPQPGNGGTAAADFSPPFFISMLIASLLPPFLCYSYWVSIHVFRLFSTFLWPYVVSFLVFMIPSLKSF